MRSFLPGRRVVQSRRVFDSRRLAYQFSCRRPVFATAVLVLMAAAALAVSSIAPNEVWAQAAGESSRASSLLPAGAEGFPRVVVDGTGKEIVLEAPPRRIFSTALALDNILLSIVPAERVIGVTRYAADPAGSYVVEKLADHMVVIDALNAELVVASQPDIVLVTSWSNQDEVRQIEALGLKVYTFTGFSTVEDALDNIRRIGEITGYEEEAGALIAEFWSRYEEVKRRIAGRQRPTVLSWDSWSTTTGLETSMHDIIEMAGGVNLAAAHGIRGWQVVDAETIIAMAPEVIITHEKGGFVEQILNDPVLQSVPAVKNRRVYAIDHAEALNHHFILAIEQLARLLHPEAF